MNQIQRENLVNFPWGLVERVHNIGDIDIIEYHPRVFKDGRGTIDFHEYTLFHAYVNDIDLSCSFESLDQALIGAIAISFDGQNTQAHRFFYKMIGI